MYEVNLDVNTPLNTTSYKYKLSASKSFSKNTPFARASSKHLASVLINFILLHLSFYSYPTVL
jgi:hypothetical protein